MARAEKADEMAQSLGHSQQKTTRTLKEKELQLEAASNAQKDVRVSRSLPRLSLGHLLEEVEA